VQAASAFARGLGLAQTPALDDAAWERVGEAVRLIVSGLIDLLNARAELKRELRVEDRTMLASRDNNPLKTGIDLASALQYLLIAQNGMPGFKPADAALREAVDELRVHELATVAASRAAVEAALREFDPETLRKQLSPGKSRLPQFFDSSRMWEAYVERYEKQGAQMADWLEKIFSRHFVPAYSRESERLKMTMTLSTGQGKSR
jgi:type VI secretion system FHA domain protein